MDAKPALPPWKKKGSACIFIKTKYRKTRRFMYDFRTWEKVRSHLRKNKIGLESLDWTGLKGKRLANAKRRMKAIRLFSHPR